MNSTKYILDKLNNRDSYALKDFFISFYPSLCVFAKKYISETDIVEDIAQEAFLVYWESKKQFENIDVLKGFLYITTKNKCLNHLRLKGLHAEIAKNSLDKEDYLYELILEEETYRIIHKAIENLPPQSRRIIELSMKGYKNPEIANELDVSINTIKTLKGNAYKVLRSNLQDHVFVLFLLNQLLNN
ncbi:RNA polymerase sigma-70 factor [Labilibacter sediminis]|nr:RNA polymerase sigma-70 factor [Labilibacter sediminis]